MKTKPASSRGKGVAELRRQQRCLLTEVCPHKLKQILVPIDFSDCSRKALRYAVPVAERFGAQILLLYVIETTVLPTEVGYVPAEVKRTGIDSVQAALEELARRTEQALGTHFVRQTTVRNGIPWQEITTAARALDVDLIVLSTHGYTGIKHILMGSTAERVVQHAPCPVLVVREREHEFVPASPVPAGMKAKPE
jgi:nucleotide-binding universal stress UspA family protein